jgi:hypothetical protein
MIMMINYEINNLFVFNSFWRTFLKKKRGLFEETSNMYDVCRPPRLRLEI